MTTREMNYPENYFRNPLRNLAFAGLSLNEMKDTNYKKLYFVWFIILFICACFYLLTEYTHVIQHFHEMEEASLGLCYIFCHSMVIGKIIILSIKKGKISNIIKLLESRPFLPNIARGGTREIDIVRRAIYLTDTQLRIFGGVIVVMMITGVFPYFKNGRILNEISPNVTEVIVKFPYPSTLPFQVDYTASPCYELVFTFQVFSMNLFGWYFINIDTLIVGCMIHIIGQFKILVNALENVSKRAENVAVHDKSSNVIKKTTFIKYNIDCNNSIAIERVETYNKAITVNLRKFINEYAYYHQEIMHLNDDMEKSLNFLFLIQFIGCLFTIVVGLYQMSVVPFGSSSFTNMATFAFAMTFEVLMHCAYGDEICFYSAEVAKAAYNCEWIKADDRIPKNLLLMMLRAQRECCLTFGKFSKINLVLFLGIMRGAFSYFTFLQRMNEE